MAAARPVAPGAASGLWEDCRNSLGIARLLVSERRPEALVDTACRMAMETACRAALEHTGALWPGDLDAALRHLHVRREAPVERSSRARLLEAEETVALVAAWLRRHDPGRPWGF